MYVEYCNNINDRGNLIKLSELEHKFRDHECYISLFPFDESIIDYVKTHDSITGHKGKHYCKYILIDIDNTDLLKARSSTIELIQRLNETYDIKPDELYIFFSGSKGFHIVLTEKIYGDLEANNKIAEQIKNAIKNIAGIIKDIDLKIYEPHRIIRVDNSVNAKTGLYKIQISFDELKEGIEHIKGIAKNPRSFKRNILNSDIRYNEKIAKLIRTKIIKTNEGKEIKDGFFRPSRKGNRNESLYQQACTLFLNSNLHEKSILEIIENVNELSEVPLDHVELIRIIQSSSKSRKTIVQDESFKIFTIAELIPEWIESTKREDNKISLIFDSLNNNFKGKLRGKFGIILGYGGSKKSLFGQNFTLDNSHLPGIYSNMEMGLSQFIERQINITMDAQYSLASIEIEEELKKDEEKTKKLLFEFISKRYSDNLIICNNTRMTSDKYRKLLDQLKAKGKTYHYLIIDGFSMMGGKGSELELANEHSKELKALAEDYNIFVLAIVHASRGEELTERNLIHKARGSEKIADNMDFGITLSQVRDGSDYYSSIGVFHCWDKRGTGKHIEKTWEFAGTNLRMIESERTINEVEKLEI